MVFSLDEQLSLVAHAEQVTLDGGQIGYRPQLVLDGHVVWSGQTRTDGTSAPDDTPYDRAVAQAVQVAVTGLRNVFADAPTAADGKLEDSGTREPGATFMNGRPSSSSSGT